MSLCHCLELFENEAEPLKICVIKMLKFHVCPISARYSVGTTCTELLALPHQAGKLLERALLLQLLSMAALDYPCRAESRCVETWHKRPSADGDNLGLVTEIMDHTIDSMYECFIECEGS